MNLAQEMKQLCQLYNIKPSRTKGQNFLVKSEIYSDIIELAEVKAEDNIVEVGPGLGFLTFGLAEIAKNVLAVELDDALAELLVLRLETKGIKNVTVVNQDILTWEPTFEKYKVVANLPYNITSIFLRRFLELKNKPESLTLMLQREVAQRIVSKTGDMNLLALMIQFYSEPEIVRLVDRKDFWPEPNVDSAVIKIKVREQLLLDDEVAIKKMFRLAKFGFSAKRKMLKNNLANPGIAGISKNVEGLSKSEISSYVLEKLVSLGLNEKCRAEDLSINDWVELSKNI